MRKKVLAFSLMSLALVGTLAGWNPSEACVGKTIYLGRLPGKEQEILGEIFSRLVGERTGTTIQVKPFADSRASHSALQKADIDLYLEDQGTALREILGIPTAVSGPEMRESLRREYEQRFNFVWLEPWGPTAAVRPPSFVAPVVRKDTLKKYPALSRLVNKLAGVLDGAALARLVQESELRPAREVVKQFLKEKRLI